MENDYILRKDALAAVSGNALAPIQKVYDAVAEVPAADAAPRQSGMWDNGVCRDCGKRPDELRQNMAPGEDFSCWPVLPPYCPNCGRRMTVCRWSSDGK